MSKLPKLLGGSVSPFVKKVMILLEEKGIKYDHEPVGPSQDEAFKKISPLGKIPAYVDEKASLADSSVICFYLERTNPQNPLYPTEPLSQARALWFEEYSDGAFVSVLLTPFFQRIVGPKFFNKPTDEKAIEEALDVKLPPMFAYLEEQIGKNEWLVDNTFSIADIAIATPFANFESCGYKVDAAKYPNLAAFVKRAFARPSFQKALAADQAFFEQMKQAA